MNNDYQLEDAEDAAVNKSKNLKRGLAAGAAILGVGGVSAYGATVLNDANAEGTDAEPITEEEFQATVETIAEAATEEDTPEAPQGGTHEVHPIPVQPETEPELVVDESSIVYDEDGNIVVTYDHGSYDGNEVLILDTDGNGKGDLVAYDENGNGVFEDHEIREMDNETYELGNGKEVAIYQQDSDGDFFEVHRAENNQFRSLVGEEGLAHNVEPNDVWPENDFDLNDKTGEVYGDDLAQNNPDYDNQGGEQYADAGEYYEEPDYGYTDPSSDLASYDGTTDTFDDVTYDA